MTGGGSDRLDLYDFRVRVLSMYRRRNAAIGAGEDAIAVWKHFWEERTDLFAHHSQSALDGRQKERFTNLSVFPYNAGAVVEATLDTDVAPERLEVPTSGEDAMPMETVGTVRFTLFGESCSLSLYWIDVYGGGLFLPFRDTHEDTYGGGRYLVDTVKGSDFLRASMPLAARSHVVLDFNYAYNPSCAYNPRWVCPLAPPSNRLTIPIPAGERAFGEDTA